MRRQPIYPLVAFIVVSILLLNSCSPKQNGSTALSDETRVEETTNNSEDQTPSVAVEVIEDEVITDSAQETTTTVLPDLPTPTPTLIVETRLAPEQWREWPVVPELTGREQAIYQRGLQLGNDPTKFSKVGDCQAIKDVLLGIYDQPDRYFLTDNDAYLQEAIDQFAGSFLRDGQAVRGGYNAAAVLSPIWADPEACNPGENPIECEYRLHKPSIVIISLEVWWEGRTVERYEEYMRQIIDFYISKGVVPILSTKADNVEGDHRINLATARLAYEYHIPLWNFWRAVQPMPNHGIDPDRDGFHISYEAWTVRSYTALQALDAVWRGVRDQEIQAEESLDATKTEELFSSITISPIPVELGASLLDERFVFSIEQRQGDITRSGGVFVYDLGSQAVYKLFDAGYQLEDIRKLDRAMLVSSDRKLFISDSEGQGLQEITDELAITAKNASAFWMPDNLHVVFLTESDLGVRRLWLVEAETNTRELVAEGAISGIVKPTSSETIYWYEGECISETNCEDVVVYYNKNGFPEPFAELDQINFSSSGRTYIWIESASEATIILYTRFSDQTGQNYLYLPGNRTVAMNWSPSDDRIALLTVVRSEYSGKSSDARIFVVDINSMIQREYLAFPGLNPDVVWHEDAGMLLLTSTLAFEERYQINFSQLDLDTGWFSSLNEDLAIHSEDFVTINQLFWIKP